MKLSCCSLRRSSRTRKIVFTTIPAMITAKNTIPKNSNTPSRQFRMIQPTFNATASATSPIPRQRKKTIVPRRLEIRMETQPDFTAFRLAYRGYVAFQDNPCIRTLTVSTKWGCGWWDGTRSCLYGLSREVFATSKPYRFKVSATAAVLMYDKNCFAGSLSLDELRMTHACSMGGYSVTGISA